MKLCDWCNRQATHLLQRRNDTWTDRACRAHAYQYGLRRDGYRVTPIDGVQLQDIRG